MSFAVIDSLEAKGLLFQWDRNQTLFKITVNTIMIALNEKDVNDMLIFLENKIPPEEI